MIKARRGSASLLLEIACSNESPSTGWRAGISKNAWTVGFRSINATLVFIILGAVFYW